MKVLAKLFQLAPLFLLSGFLLSGLTILSSSASAQLVDDRLQVHSERTKVFIADIPTTDFEVLRRTDEWQIVRFAEPVVPVWFSRDFVRVDGNTATVTANGLNLRNQPNLDSAILALVTSGFRRPILKESNGFMQVHAPVAMTFAIPVPGVAGVVEQQQNKHPAPLPVNQNQAVPDSSTVEATTESVSDQTVGEVRPTDSVESEPITESQLDATEPQVLYRLSPGDTISLLVFGEPDLSMNGLRIPQSGQVSFPLIGEVAVTGKTTTEVERIVRDELSGGYVRSPRLTITIDSYRPVFVRGGTVKVGAFPYSEDLSIAKLIALAGGPKNSARKNGVSISRDGQLVATNLQVDSERRVFSGDVILIEEDFGVSEESASYVYLHGEVNRPGEYQFRRGLTVEKAVVLAGGFSLRASRRKVSITRIVEGQEKPEKLTKVDLYLPVKPGDIIDVGASWF